MRKLILMQLMLTGLIFSCQHNETVDHKKELPTSWEGLRDIRVTEVDSTSYGLANSIVLRNDSIFEFHYPFKLYKRSKLIVDGDSLIKESSTERTAMKWDYTDTLLTISYHALNNKGLPSLVTEIYVPRIFNKDTLREILDFGFALDKFVNTKWYFYKDGTEAVTKDSLQMELYRLPSEFKPIDLDFSFISERKIRLYNDTFFVRHYLGTFMSLDLLNHTPTQFFLFQDSSRIH